MSPVLTEEEIRESQIEGFYGKSRSYFHVDHKGRIFVGEDDDRVVILNEADDAEKVLPKIIELCQRWLDWNADNK